MEFEIRPPVFLRHRSETVLPISDAQNDAARAVHERLRAAGVRSHLDDRSETLNYKIREGETLKVPFLAVIGQREADAGTVAVRVRSVSPPGGIWQPVWVAYPAPAVAPH